MGNLTFEASMIDKALDKIRAKLDREALETIAQELHQIENALANIKG
jgi:RNA polymerase-binding transcription factor DksA